MNKSDDYIDKALYEYVNNISFDGFTKEEIKNIVAKAKKNRKVEIYKMVAVLSFFIILSVSCVLVYKNYTSSNENIVYTSNIDMKSQMVKETIQYTLDNDKNSNILISDNILPEENVYVIKVESILEYCIVNGNPKTKLKGTVIKNMKEEKSDNIEFVVDGGIFNVNEIIDMMNIKLDSEYQALSDNEKVNTYIRVLPVGLAIPEIQKTYLVTLDNDKNVIYNAKYPFLEYDINKNEYKDENEWKIFEYER